MARTHLEELSDSWMTDQESSQAPRFGPRSGYFSHRPAIDQLPQELLDIIFHLCLDSGKRVTVRTRLMLVCRIWKAIIEGTPSFWTRIEAIDGLKHARNAITKTGELPIDLILDRDDSVSVDEFLAEVSGKVSRWRSVELSFRILPTSFGGLQTSACHSLEKLTLQMEDLLPSTLPLALFDRGPSPAVLKDLYLSSIPVDLAVMQLSNLSSLVLIDVHYIRMDDVLLVLRSSPALVTLQLEEIAIASLDIPDGGVGLPILLESLTACQFQLSIPLIRFLLSAIHSPSLEYLQLYYWIESSFPNSSIFSPPISGFEPTLKRLLSTAEHIEVQFKHLANSSITFGGL